MTIQVITIGTQELQGIISDAYRDGYIKAQRDWVAEQAAKTQEPKFGEIIRGCKELRQYLIYKEYWNGSLSSLSKVAPQLVEQDDKKSHGLIFRRTCIDYSFQTGFRFQQPLKKHPK
jgi:hypothetical protein